MSLSVLLPPETQSCVTEQHLYSESINTYMQVHSIRLRYVLTVGSISVLNQFVTQHLCWNLKENSSYASSTIWTVERMNDRRLSTGYSSSRRHLPTTQAEKQHALSRNTNLVQKWTPKFEEYCTEHCRNQLKLMYSDRLRLLHSSLEIREVRLAAFKNKFVRHRDRNKTKTIIVPELPLVGYQAIFSGMQSVPPPAHSTNENIPLLRLSSLAEMANARLNTLH